MKRAFTLIEMMIALFLTAMVFTYLYAVLDNVKKEHLRYERSVARITDAQKIYDLMIHDLSQIRSPVRIIHEAGYDRISFFTAHSVYGIARPWVHYFVSRKEDALIRIESTVPIDFLRTSYIGDAQGTYFFADRLAKGCDSLRFSVVGSKTHMMLKCTGIEPIVATLYVGDAARKPR